MIRRPNFYEFSLCNTVLINHQTVVFNKLIGVGRVVVVEAYTIINQFTGHWFDSRFKNIFVLSCDVNLYSLNLQILQNDDRS